MSWSSLARRNQEVMLAQAATYPFWTGFTVDLVTDSGVRKEPFFCALYLVVRRSMMVSIPLSGYLWRKDVLLFRFMKWQERLWGEKKQSLVVSSPRSLVWHFEKAACWSFSTRRGSCDKSQDWGMHWWGPSRALAFGKSCCLLPLFWLYMKTHPRNTEA